MENKKTEVKSQKAAENAAKKMAKKAAAKREISVNIEIPAGVDVKRTNNDVVVSGSGKSLSKSFAHPRIKVDVVEKEGRAVVINTKSTRKKERAVVGTWSAHIRNMITGVTRGFAYKLKIIYTHFPINVKVVGTEIQVSNFLGERGYRGAPIIGDTKVTVEKEIITVRGANIENVGGTCSNLEQACALRRVDRRKFPDGIYLFEKGFEK